ncbi:MAG: hypothetical protein L6R39_005737 [Caloplaca ligustica]|nr:MAG: hypothetical protein L6R39_005737 [Caloplaca ligustica]
MLLFWDSVLLLLNISFAVAVTSPAPDARISQINLPSNIPDGLARSPVEVHLANQTLSAGREIACFIQHKPPREQLHWISDMDCFGDMARGLLLGDDVMERKKFTLYGRPFSWNAGTCMIIIDQSGAAAPGIQKAEIAHIAALVTRICVSYSLEDEPLGGQALMGDGDAYRLTVYGRPPQ